MKNRGYKVPIETIQGSTIRVRCVRTHAYFYWRTHDLGHAYVDIHTHFFPKIFKNIFL